MKKIILIAVCTLAIALPGMAQDLMFGKFLGSINPTNFTGNAAFRGYEKQVEITELLANTQNRSTTISVKFSPSPASAEFLVHAQLDKRILKGQLEVLEKNATNPALSRVKYKLYFEDATVVSCTDSSADNKSLSTTVVLKPQRISWIYYTYDALSGKATGTTTHGFDLKSGESWTVTPSGF